jgi:hypothetical protein
MIQLASLFKIHIKNEKYCAACLQHITSKYHKESLIILAKHPTNTCNVPKHLAKSRVKPLEKRGHWS